MWCRGKHIDEGHFGVWWKDGDGFDWPVIAQFKTRKQAIDYINIILIDKNPKEVYLERDWPGSDNKGL